MKLTPREADGYFQRPDPDKAGLLIHGADAMRVALKRQQVLGALLGASAEEEMRLSRMSGADLRKDSASLLDAVKAVGFFPGPRAVFVEEAGDGIADIVSAALAAWQPGDAQIVVTAGQLKATSRLRKLFEGQRNALSAAIYDDPPSRGEIERLLGDRGMTDIPGSAMAALTALAAELNPGDFIQTLEKIALFKLGDAEPLSPEEIALCAPSSTDAALDDILNIVAECRQNEVGPTLARLQAQGTNPVTLCIGAMRHFRMLYAAASDPGGPAAGVGKLRPPVFGQRRDRLLRQLKNWPANKLQVALTLITETDLLLRSAGQTAPGMAVMERALIRLAMLPQGRD